MFRMANFVHMNDYDKELLWEIAMNARKQYLNSNKLMNFQCLVGGTLLRWALKKVNTEHSFQ